MTEDEFLKLIESLDENKTTRMDGVSTKLLRMAAPVLTGLLTKIFYFI